MSDSEITLDEAEVTQIIEGLSSAVSPFAHLPDEAVAAVLSHLFSWGWVPSRFEDGNPKAPYDCRYCGHELFTSGGCAPACPNRLLLSLMWQAQLDAGWRSPDGGYVGGYVGPELPAWERSPDV